MISIFRPQIAITDAEFSVRLSTGIGSRLIRLGFFLLIVGGLSQIENVNHSLKATVIFGILWLSLSVELYRFRIIRYGSSLRFVASRLIFGSKRAELPLASVKSVESVRWLGLFQWVSLKTPDRSIWFRLAVPFNSDKSREIHRAVSEWIMGHVNESQLAARTTETILGHSFQEDVSTSLEVENEEHVAAGKA